jgi:hypothetical protein
LANQTALWIFPPLKSSQRRYFESKGNYLALLPRVHESAGLALPDRDKTSAKS